MTNIEKKLDLILQFIVSKNDPEIQERIANEAKTLLEDRTLDKHVLLNRTIIDVLSELGVTARRRKGFDALVYALELIIENENIEYLRGNLNNQLYPTIAERIPGTNSGISNAIARYVRFTMNEPSTTTRDRLFGIGRHVTVRHFLMTVAEEVRNRLEGTAYDL